LDDTQIGAFEGYFPEEPITIALSSQPDGAGQPQAARNARQQAVQALLAYRRGRDPALAMIRICLISRSLKSSCCWKNWENKTKG
jgi:hypothetical protein